MKNLWILGFLAFCITALYSCKSNNLPSQLAGQKRTVKWNPVTPPGMIYVPAGNLSIGQSDQDINNSQTQRKKSISVQGFYMDDTEITNFEYRQFVNWVRDSMALVALDAFIEDEGGNQKLDWDYPIDWSGDSEDAEGLSNMYYSGEDVFYGKKEFDVRKFVYKYDWYDWKAAAASTQKRDGSSRSDFIIREEINVYPDTLCWINDFSYSMNEPMARNYFGHPAYDEYPAVGIDWNQATAYCAWRTKIWNEQGEGAQGESFRLPTESEWEYAARGGLEGAPYPWGGPYIRNRKGCLLANFKPGRGNYAEDGGAYTVKVGSYNPNGFGLYDMAGNVAEWTSSAYFENAYSFIHDMNPDIRWDADETDPETLKRKVIRGGSWKDVGYFLQTGTRHWEYQDTSKSYIGFRCALTFLGRSMSDHKYR